MILIPDEEICPGFDQNVPQGGDCGNNNCDVHVNGETSARDCEMTSMGDDIADMSYEAKQALFCDSCRVRILSYINSCCVRG